MYRTGYKIEYFELKKHGRDRGGEEQEGSSAKRGKYIINQQG